MRDRKEPAAARPRWWRFTQADMTGLRLAAIALLLMVDRTVTRLRRWPRRG